jgi:GMP synthase-like glutamine amidotransferase
MPETLLVNCYQNPAKITELRNAINKFSPCQVVSYQNVPSGDVLGGFSAVVISGSETRIVNPQDKAKFEGVLKLVETCDVPLLGVCFGHQLLCSAFGAKTGTLPKPVIDRFEQINVLQTGEIFSRFKQGQAIPLAEYHNDYVLKESLDSACFKLLADSASCPVEAVKHRTNLFFGVQFHPERVTIGNETHMEGHRVIENFFVHMVKRFGV